MTPSATPLPPGSTIGILGGGQLGRMLALAAARLGLKTHIYSDQSGPAFDVAAKAVVGAYDDLAHLAEFAATVDVITYEFENVPVIAARHIEVLKPVRPGPLALEVAQDRVTEKAFIRKLGLPVADFFPVGDRDALQAAMQQMAASAILKTRRLGYDGKGQVSIKPGDNAEAAFDAIGRNPAVLERRLAFTAEISALIVRASNGQTAIYDLPVNTHRDGILRVSVVPSSIPDALIDAARSAAKRIADALGYVGVLAVEMFVMPEGSRDRIVINEIAPRVHNSGHWTMDACAVGQFENHVRAIAGWPLGSTERHSDARMENLIGHDADGWGKLAATPGVCLHLYGKREARDGRKMGHVNRLSPRT